MSPALRSPLALFGGFLAFATVPAAGQARANVPAAPTPSPASATVLRPSFDEWLGSIRQEALGQGIRPETVEAALSNVSPQPEVLERDQAQPEFTLSFERYAARRLKKQTIETARRMYALHRETLRDVGAAYGVQAQYLVAVWGLESEFGRFRGVRPTIPTLATLAYDSRRAEFFHGQLLDALRILDRGDVELAEFKGSWAGALGQPQFLPSVYLEHAQDFDGDGRRDIWNTPADVFASIAAYLGDAGWTDGEGWGFEVKAAPPTLERIARTVPTRSGGCSARRKMSDALEMARWRALGVRATDGRLVPSSSRQASFVRAGRRAFLVYPNYDAILTYNCAHHYALCVGLLANSIAAK